MSDIRLPKLNSNDDVYTLVAWLVADGQPVAAGQEVVCVETSKAAQELVSDAAGVLQVIAQAGSECAPGEVIGRIVPPGAWRSTGASEEARPADPVITAPAQALIDELGIDVERVRGLGLKLVRLADVQRLAATPPGGGRLHRLPAAQQAVARTVTRAHQGIPAAYTVVAVDVGAAHEVARQWGWRLRKLVGLPELLVAAVGRLHTRFPLCFAEPVDEATVRLPDEAHVGVTMDVGRGLFVPVVRHASTRSFEEIVDVLGGFRRAALAGDFRERDLAGGNIAITLHHSPDVVMAVPILFPGHTCALALAGTRAELTQTPDGGIAARSVTHLGLAYDHRTVNGRDAVLFLQAVKEALESPERPGP